MSWDGKLIDGYGMLLLSNIIIITITTPPPLSSFQQHYYTITITTVSTTTINSIPASQSLEHHQNNLIIRSSRIIIYAIHGCCCFRVCINYVMQQTIQCGTMKRYGVNETCRIFVNCKFQTNKHAFCLQLSDDSQLDFQITFLIIEIKTRIHPHFTNSTKAW